MADVTGGPLRTAVIIGSTRDGRFGPVVADWIGEHIAQREDMTADLVDLVETPMPTVFPAYGQTPSDEVMAQLGAVTPRLAEADAFVIVTPEYNHSFPAPLKQVIDAYSVEWQAKPAAFVCYGGISGGLRAVEQLRQVFAELHVVTIRDTVSVHGVWSHVGPDGRLIEDAARAGAAQAMLTRLIWWARALRTARQAAPYAA
jgi:NAD(P)H-dependent FMN reductase